MKKAVLVSVILAVAVLLPNIFKSEAIERMYVSAKGYSPGSTGASVSNIQQNLKLLGYYKGNINGVFDSQTCAAVKGFQSANDMDPDGVVKAKTIKILNMQVMAAAKKNAGKSQSSGRDVALLARAINGEARGEPYIGAVAVGAVVMNRTRNPKFPNTIAGVIYQPGAFTAVTDGQINANMEPQATKAARDALNGWDPSGGAIYYFNPAKTTNKWIWSRPLIKVIGKHRFCR